MGILSRLLTPKYLKEMKAGKPMIVISESMFPKNVPIIIELADTYGYDLANMSQSKEPNPFAGQFMSQYTMIFKKRR